MSSNIPLIGSLPVAKHKLPVLFRYNCHPTAAQQHSPAAHAVKLPQEHSGGQTTMVQHRRPGQKDGTFLREHWYSIRSTRFNIRSILSGLSPIAKGTNGRVRWLQHRQHVLLALSAFEHLPFWPKCPSAPDPLDMPLLQ